MDYGVDDMADKVLLADDSVSMRQMSAFILTQAGYEVVQAIDGVDALSKLTEDVNVILTDLNMPNMNGIDFIKAVRNGKINRLVPIIMVTTEFDGALKQKGREAGATAWIVKPYNEDSLLSVIQKVKRKIKSEKNGPK